MPRGAWTLWNEVPQPTRAQLRRLYRILREDHGGFTSRMAKTYAKTVCEIWQATDAVSEETAKHAGHRRHGKGRRPTSQKIRLLVKRQALQATTLDTALSKLAAIVAKDRAKKLATLPRRMA